MKKLSLTDYFLLAFGALAIVGAYLRIYFGVDFSDESYYVALPYRFILGDNPFINEYAVHQLSALLLLPFYKIFYFLNNNTNGIILYSRHLYFFSFLLLGCLAFKTFKKELGTSVAFIIACICAFYIPFNIMNLSYNTMAVLFLSAASFFAMLAEGVSTEEKGSDYYLSFAGLFYCLAIFSYPSMILPALVAILVIFVRTGIKQSIGKLLLGSMPLLILSGILFGIYKLNIFNTYFYLKHIGYLTSDKQTIHHLLRDWGISILYPKLIAFFLLGMLIIPFLEFQKNMSYSVRRGLFIFSYSCAIVFPVTMVFLYSQKFLTYHNPLLWYFLLINLSLLGPFYFVYCYRNVFARQIFFYLWLPAFFAGLATASSSGNGFIGGIIGSYSAFLATIVLMFFGIKTAMPIVKHSLQRNINVFPTLFVVFMLSFVMMYKFSNTYRDEIFYKLSTQMNNGPYKFLYTTYSKSEFLYRLQDDIDYIAKNYSAKNIIVYPANSGFYLFSKLRPRTNALWLIPDIDNKFTLSLFEKSGKPDVSLIFNQPPLDKENALFKSISSDDDYLNYIDRRLYTIYVQKKIMQ